MGLFDRKKTTFDSVAPLYTVGNSQTLLVIGLGNPGDKYVGNRHNIGFMVLDKYHLTHDFSGWVQKKDLDCELATGQVGSTRVILAKPTTFMNNSGDAAQKLQKFYRIYNQETVVVHDELDVDFGTIRTRIGGGSAGHNGIKSLSTQIGEDYGRIRIGIGPKKPDQIDSADFVLQDFSGEQRETLPKIVREACSLIDEATTGTLPEHTVNIL
jgi:peptidyl-tRNA hydrolase, PTH1 family